MILGLGAIAAGLCGVIVAATYTPERHRNPAATGGPGWWVGALIRRLPFGAARVAWAVLGLGIVALGVWYLATR